MLHTAEQGGRGGPCKHMIAGPARQQETFKLRDYQRGEPQGPNPEGAIRSSKGFLSRRRQMIVIHCITANFAQIMTWRFTEEDLAEESFPFGCCLQHYANTGTS